MHHSTSMSWRWSGLVHICAGHIWKFYGMHNNWWNMTILIVKHFIDYCINPNEFQADIWKNKVVKAALRPCPASHWKFHGTRKILSVTIDSSRQGDAWMRQLTKTQLVRIVPCRLFGAKALFKLNYYYVNWILENSGHFELKWNHFHFRKSI